MFKDTRIGLPHKILYRGSVFGLTGKVLGSLSGSRRVLAQGRDLRR